MVYPCQVEHFKIEIEDLHTQTACNKVTGKQILKLFEDLVTMQVQADRSSRKSALAGLILVIAS